MKRTERLMALAEHLRGRRSGVTAEQLADRFGVTMRTMYRDLESLREAQMPIHAERGRGGGYALDKGYTLPPVNFTAREAAILLTAGHWITTLRMLPFTGTLQSALDKVRAALSASAQREAQTLMKSLVFTGVPTLPVDPRVRAVLEQAWFERRWVHIVYVSSKSIETEHLVRLQTVLLERNETILHAVEKPSGDERPFRLHHIMRARLAPDADA